MPKILDLKMDNNTMEQNTAGNQRLLVRVFNQPRTSSIAFGITAIKHAVFPLGSPFGSIKNPIDFLPLYILYFYILYFLVIYINVCVLC